MNHTHEYPRIDLFYEQADPHHDNENPTKVEITSIGKRILILVGKKIHQLIVQLQVYLTI